MPGVVDVARAVLVRFVGPMSERSELFLTETRSIFELTTHSDRETRFQFPIEDKEGRGRTRKVWAHTCSGLSLSKRSFARRWYATKGKCVVPSTVDKPCILQFNTNMPSAIDVLN